MATAVVGGQEPGTVGAPPDRGERRGRRRLVTAVAVAVAVGLLAAAGLLLLNDEEKPVAADEVVGGVSRSEISTVDLEKVARTRVFFGHQSVGGNILDGVPAVYAAHGVQAPPIEERRTAPEAATGGFISHALVGENYEPVQKIKDFDAVIRGGVGGQVDVAVLKLCYIDVTPGTDVDAVFATYRDTMAALERDFPQVAFVKTTVPLTTEPGRLAKVKQWANGNDDYGAAANATRERLNQMIRKEYRDDHLFDVAAVESTAGDGSRSSGRHDQQPYFVLYDGYAADSGHLNEDGSLRAATAWLAAVAQASTR